MDGSENFERLWADYAAGFGSRSGEYWLGLENMHFLTTASSSLVIEMEAFPKAKTLTSVETYSDFSIGNAASSYALSVSGYVLTGTECSPAKDGWDSGDFALKQSGLPFSTEDQETNNYSGAGCSWNTRSGWWHEATCFPFSLNGFYHQAGYTADRGFFYEGIAWYTCWDYTYSLMKTTMRVKRN